jgi:hypothetical protein
MKEKFFTFIEPKQALRRKSAMETGNHFKNGASSKRTKSRVAANRLLGIVAALAAVWFMASCGDSNTPSGIAKTFYTQIRIGNYEKACRTVLPPDIYTAEMEKEGTTYEEGIKYFSEILKNSYESAGSGLKSFSVVKEDISEDGEKATVSISLLITDGSKNEIQHSFVKENGKWRMILK